MKRKYRKDDDKELNVTNRHHIVPDIRGGKWDKPNIKRVNVNHHRWYHWLFGNRKPDEIITLLVNDFWNGQWHWVAKALKDRR